MSNTAEPAAYLRLPAVAVALHCSTSKVYELIRRGEFPRGIRLGARTVVWPARIVDEWLAARMAARE